MNFPDIKYPFPKKGAKNPFDLHAEENLFVDARGFSYLFDELDYEKIYSAIPSGYKSLITLERAAFFKRGKLIKEWNQQATSYEKKPVYMLFSNKSQYNSNGKGTVASYSVYRPDNKGNSYWEAIWEDPEECSAYAKQFSKKGNNILMARVLQSIDWH